jgi:hypothetical protein
VLISLAWAAGETDGGCGTYIRKTTRQVELNALKAHNTDKVGALRAENEELLRKFGEMRNPYKPTDKPAAGE